MSEWQPIETAPKDGTDIDLWLHGFRVADCYWDKVAGEWCDSDGDRLTENVVDYGQGPTHWMPHPEPPK